MPGPTEIPELDDVLLALRTAEIASNEVPLEFLLLHMGGMQRGLKARGWEDDQFTPTQGQVDLLEERGLLQTLPSGNVQRKFRLTDDGRRFADLLAAEHGGSERRPIKLDWDEARSLLARMVDEYEKQGAPELGIAIRDIGADERSQEEVAALVRHLESNDFIDTVGMTDQGGPRFVTPTHRALELLRQWPSTNADSIIDELLSALSEQIDATTDEKEKTALIRVRDGIAGAARDVFVGVLTGLAKESI